MGFNKMPLKLMVDHFNKTKKRPFGKILTLGRQYICFDKDCFNSICNYEPGEMRGIHINEDSLLNDEIVFKTLGFEHVDSMDYSEYEFATLVHDLNDTNIPKELENKYDFILDGGTIEHIFNFRNVLENIFKMLKVGGVFFFEQPTMHMHNFNHGYYHFSPSVFYEYFKANKYEINYFIPYAKKDDYIYMLDPVVNNIFGHIPLIDNSVNLVCGAVTKTSETIYDAIPYQGAFADAWQAKPNIITKDVFGTADENSIYLYGTGNYAFYYITMLTCAYRNKIAGLISNNPDEIGSRKYGYEIKSLEQIPDIGCKIIVIATGKQFQDTVFDRIKHLQNDGTRVVRLHDYD